MQTCSAHSTLPCARSTVFVCTLLSGVASVLDDDDEEEEGEDEDDADSVLVSVWGCVVGTASMAMMLMNRKKDQITTSIESRGSHSLLLPSFLATRLQAPPTKTNTHETNKNNSLLP